MLLSLRVSVQIDHSDLSSRVRRALFTAGFDPKLTEKLREDLRKMKVIITSNRTRDTSSSPRRTITKSTKMRVAVFDGVERGEARNTHGTCPG